MRFTPSALRGEINGGLLHQGRAGARVAEYHHQLVGQLHLDRSGRRRMIDLREHGQIAPGDGIE